MEKELPIYQCTIDDDVNSVLQVEYIALVGQPAIERNFMAFNKERLRFNVDNKKRIISGPAMIADMLIYRNMEPLGEFYTVFNKDTIATVVQKFFKKGYVKNFNLMHDAEQQTSDITIYESFLTDKERGIMPPKGFEDVADGSWFITAKVEDDNAWAKVEDGTFKGFSVEGIFEQIPIKTTMSAENILERIGKLLQMLPELQ
jgi:putative serine protease XkdF